MYRPNGQLVSNETLCPGQLCNPTSGMDFLVASLANDSTCSQVAARTVDSRAETESRPARKRRPANVNKAPVRESLDLMTGAEGGINALLRRPPLRAAPLRFPPR